jgi:hypothetical protein
VTSILAGATVALLGQASALPFSDPLDGAAKPGWRVAPTAFVSAPDGSRGARFARGTTWSAEGQPWVGDSTWYTYRIEVDVWPETNWAGVDFHVQEEGKAATELTLYPLEDGTLAFELSGIWGAASAWKLWPVGQKMPERPKGWVRLRVDVGIDVANVFVGEPGEVVATFRDLPFRSGGVRLASYYGSALFRDLRITRLEPSAVVPLLEDPWKEVRGTGILRDWRVSPRLDTGVVPLEPPRADSSWLSPAVDGRGVVHLTSLFRESNASGTVFARTTLSARTSGEARLRLTYTDGFALWCNKLRVFEGPPRQWFHVDRAKNGFSRLIPDQYEVVVPVREGDNELVVRSETTEPFGWGFWLREIR